MEENESLRMALVNLNHKSIVVNFTAQSAMEEEKNLRDYIEMLEFERGEAITVLKKESQKILKIM